MRDGELAPFGGGGGIVYDRIFTAALATDRPFIYDVAENGRLKRIKLP
jgi:hypothetical protein